MNASLPSTTGRPIRRRPKTAPRTLQRARIDWRLPVLAIAIVVAVAVWVAWRSVPDASRSTPEAAAALSTMGPLEPNTNRQGRDLSISGSLAASAKECALLCGAASRCKAMSYAKGTTGEAGRCWLKESVPAAAPNDLMTSAVKLHAASAP